jgi:hypothetical protein
VGAATDKLFKFDLASLPGFIGGTVQVAQLRLYRSSGNTYGAGLTIGRVLTHDWTEALAMPRNPTGGSTLGWGVASNARFSTAGDVSTPLGGMTNSTNYLVATVTSDVQAFAAGTPNYGWSVATGNSIIYMSENTDSRGYQPVLFLSYTPAVPEPTTLLLIGMGLVGLLRRKA